VSVSTNHKIPCLLGFTLCTHRPYTAILDTGAGPNLIRQDQLPPDWETHQPARKPPEATVRDANGRELNVMGHLRLSCRVGNHTTGATFFVLEHLAVPLILGCDYIDKNVHSLQPGIGKVTLKDGSHVSLIRSQPFSGPAIVRCAKQITLPSWSETNVLAVSTAEGLCHLDPQVKPRILRRGYQMADGLAQVTTLVPFDVRVLNMSHRDVPLNKGTILGLAHMDHTNLVCVVDLNDQTAGVGPPSAATTQGRPPTTDWTEALHLDHLPSEARAKVIYTLTPFEAMWNGTLGEMKTPPHRIELLPGAQPVFQPPYRAGKAGRAIEQREVERMLKAGVIEPATSEWASPVVLITKKDGETRFCVDYRRLNAVTKKDSYPLPRMDECLDSLGEAGIFTTLDCNSGYWQIPVAPEDRDKTAFVSHEGLYRFIRMPFGLVNAPATFQRSIDLILMETSFNISRRRYYLQSHRGRTLWTCVQGITATVSSRCLP
jgi:Reverse transcriptase (RNA-dependent DNA polymerase)/Retroviral aspartyl protease